MSTQTLQNKTKRIQIGFNTNEGLDNAIQNLTQKYYGLSLTEIIKLAIIELNNSALSTDQNGFNLTTQNRIKNSIQRLENGEGTPFDNIKDLNNYVQNSLG